MNTTSAPRNRLLSILSAVALLAGLIAASPASASSLQTRQVAGTQAAGNAIAAEARKTVRKCSNRGKYLARYFRGRKFRGKPVKKRCERRVRATYNRGESPINRRNFSVTWTKRTRLRARRYGFRAVAADRIAIRVDGKRLVSTHKNGKYVSRVRRLRRAKHKVQFRYVKRGRTGYVKGEYVRAPDRSAPRRPRRVRAKGGDGSVALRWRGSHEVDLRGYRVYRNGKRLAEVTGTRYTDSKAKNGRTYRYWIRSIDYRGNDSRRSKVRRATPEDTTQPATPTGLDAEPGNGTVELTWTANTESDLARYIIRRDGKWLARVDASATSYADDTVENGVEYTYTLIAKDDAGNKSARSVSVSVTPLDDVAPSAPSNLTVTETDGAAVLDWADNPAADRVDHYDVYRRVNNPNIDLTGDPYRGDLTESTLTDENVTTGSTYYYQVVAIDGSGNRSAASPIKSLVVGDQQAPAAPTGVTAGAGDGHVTLEWTASTSGDVTGYRIYRSTTPTVDLTPGNLVDGIGDTTAYDDTGVENGTTYYYAIVAVDQADNASPSSEIAFATPTDMTAPAAPSGLTATGGDAVVTLGWDASGEADVAGYRVYRAESADVPTGPAATPISGTGLLPTPTYTDETVANGTTYYYAVVAVDDNGNASEASATADATPADTTPPAPPTGLAATPGDGVVGLDWDDNAEGDLDHYVVYRGTAPDLSDAASVAEVTTSGYTDEDVTNGTTYHYYVVAVDADENASPASEEVVATPADANAPAAPTGLTATAQPAAIDLSWDANTEGDLAGYNVFRSGLPDVPTDGDPLNTDLLSEPTYTDDTAVAGTEYFYVVVAVDDAGNASAPSDAASATIPHVPEVHEDFSFTTTGDQNVPAGYTKNDGSAFTDAAGVGWVEEASLEDAQHTPLDLTRNTRVRDARPGVSELQRRLIHLHYGDILPPGSNGNPTAGAFELAVPDGWYRVKVSVGDQPGGSKAGCPDPCYDSQHTVNIEGATAIDAFQATPADEFDSATEVVEVTDGRLTVDAIGGNNTKINYLEVDSTTEPAGPDLHQDVRFSDQASAPPAGYAEDFGQAYGARTGPDQGSGLSYGWLELGTDDPLDLVGNGRNRVASGDAPSDTPDLLAGLMHMQYPDNGSNGIHTPGYWEMGVPDGAYEVSVSVGDAGSAVDSQHWLNIEGQNAIADFLPTGGAGSPTHHDSATRTVTVDDGRLTVSPESGTNTKINWVTIDSVPGASARPSVLTTTPDNLATGVSPDTTSVVGDLDLVGGGVDESTLTSDTVTLTKVSDGTEVDGTAYTSGGADTIGFSPANALAPNTLYRFQVTDGVEDVDGNAFLPYSMVFETGESDTGGGAIAFDQQDTGAPNGANYTSVVVGPDGKLYAGSITGQIYRFDIESDGTLSNRQTITTVKDYSNSSASDDTYKRGKRTVIGLTFDPASTASNLILWISDNAPYIGDRDVPDFTGRIAKLTGPNLENYTAVLDGLPRSIKDHETNSIAFGPDGALYFNQGANNAMGAPDGAWGNREEHLLSAAVLRLDTSALPSQLPIDVRTAPAGNYDPFAAGAPLTIYATGVRNAYDLVWHSNGHLYVPTNGSAAGGNVPAVPADLPAVCAQRPDGGYTGPSVDAVQNNPAETDYVFDVKQGQYYGHPNPSRCEYVLNNGNPTSGTDPFENSKYPVGTLPDPNYALSDVYDAGKHASANGVIEYQGGAFGGALDGKLLYIRYSQGEDIVTFDVAADGTLSNRTVGHTGFTGFNKPLDLTEDVATGNLYVTELSGGSSGIVVLTPQGGGGGAVPKATDRLVFSGPTGATSEALDAVVSNDGAEDLVVTDVTIAGDNPGQFEVDASSLPQTVAPGDSVSLPVTFQPSSTGVKAADLVVTTDAATKIVRLRGLAAAGLGGGDEPSLQRVMDTLEIPIDVGDEDDSTAAMPNTQGMIGDEIPAQLFKKASFDAPISITPVAAYGPQNADPAIKAGWYEPGSASALHEQFTVSADDVQGLMIDPSGSTTGIDPGEDAAFGFYGQWPEFGDRKVYTEDALNSSFDAGLPHHARVYPLKNPDGSIEPDAYVVAYEEIPGSFDSQDLVLIVRNVEPYVPEAADAVLETTNLDGVPYDDRLVFSRIQDEDGDEQQTHDVSTVRISNTGTESMRVTDLNVVGSFEVSDAPAVPIDIAPGAHADVSVKFTATGGDINTGELTMISNAGTNGVAHVGLAGFWQSQSEGGQEPDVAEIADVFGYTTDIPRDLNANGLVQAVGDEVLSPYWRQADETEDIDVRQIAAFHGYPGGNTVKWFAKGGATANLMTHHGNWAQSVLPLRNNGDTAKVSFDPSAEVFGFKVNNESSDDTQNNQSVDEANGCPGPCGHHVRFFPVEDRSGDRVANTYLLVMDFAGVNYDYNDNVYLIENIEPELLITPKGLSALAEDGKVTLTWSPTGQEGVQYRVWRGTSPDVPIDAAHRVSGTDALSEPAFVDTDVTNGTTYYYVVRAVIPGESNSASTEPVPATPNTAGAFVEEVNFQSAAAPVPSGYLRDFGQPYGPRSGANQGSGLSYGWLAESDRQPVDLSVGGSTPGNGRDRDAEDDQRLDTLMHMQGDDVPDFNGTPIEGVWELAVPDGTYAVTVAAGDPNVNSDPEIHTINVEGVNAINDFVPTGPAGSPSHHETATVEVTVTDGRLTIDALGGVNTKIDYVDIAATN